MQRLRDRQAVAAETDHRVALALQQVGREWRGG
jgi:hypothetical protein